MFYAVLWTLICKLFCDILVLERVHDYKICNRNLMQGSWKRCYKSFLTHWIATDYSKIVINNFKIQIKIQVCAGIGIFLSSMLNWMFDFLFHVQNVDIKVHKSTYRYMNLHVLIFRLFCMCYTRNCVQNYFFIQSFCIVIHLFCIFNCNMSEVHKNYDFVCGR